MRLAAVGVVAAAGCMGPLVPDTQAPSGQLLPAGATVPSGDDDPLIAAQIRMHEFVSGTVPLYSVFGGGMELQGWDLGPVPDHTSPMFELFGLDGMPIQHPEIVDFIPGDPSYSPYWSVWRVDVTPKYAGEQITSVVALDEALRLGLVEAPVAQDEGVNFPIVTGDIRLMTLSGTPADSDERFYYHGVSLTYFALGDVPLATDKVTVQAGKRYVLAREGADPLSEVLRHVDMDGDGDTDDTNDILSGVTAGDQTGPAYRTVSVQVVPSVMSIDSSQNQGVAQLKTETQLFDPMPVVGTVVSFDTTDEIRDFTLANELGMDSRMVPRR